MTAVEAVGEARRARAYLLRVAEPPAPALAAFASARGVCEAAARVRAGQVPDPVAQETSARRELELADRDLAEAARFGMRLITPEDEEWPAWPLLSLDIATGRGLRGLAPPIAFWGRGEGRLDGLTERAVAVVGARAATGYGEHTAAEFAHGLAGAGLTVVSGAAYGIDGAAHRGCLAADRPTIAVLGCGLDAGYPAGHVGLLDRIARNGLVISEYPPGTPPARHRFLVRNRLIAALSSGTVVIEAGGRSGARNTAGRASALGKVVMAVPGPVGSVLSVGCHSLIREGEATLVASVADVLDSVGPLGSAAPAAARPKRSTDGLSAQALRVHEALGGRQGKSPDRVATESGVPLPRVRALLPELELEGLAERCASGWRRTGRGSGVGGRGDA